MVDEAGMLDQDTARALLTVADECRLRIALLGDRHQLAAVGRGGVLDLAARSADPADRRTLDVVQRFIRTDAAGRTVPDTDYAKLTLAMRQGDDPRAVFDALCARGQIRLYPDAAARLEALVTLATASYAEEESVAVVVDTREQSVELNAAIRDRLVADGRVDDVRTATTRAGQRIGAGDRVATRRNDRGLGVANRDAWIVTAGGPHGTLTVTPADLARGDVTRAGVTPAASRDRVLPAGYVAADVELAYASTAHGVQGGTVTASHVVVGERTCAAAAYVGMTRGRTANTAHLVARDLAEARRQWIAVFARDRADLGPAHAAELAAQEAARYASPRPLNQVLTELNAAWTAEQRCLEQLNVLQARREVLRLIVAVDADHADQLVALVDRQRQTAIAAQRAHDRAEVSGAIVTAEADRRRDTLLARWDAQRDDARQAARIILTGPGRLGLRRFAVNRAETQLADCADRWRPCLPTLPIEPHRLAGVAFSVDDRLRLRALVGDIGRRQAEAAHPEQARLRAAAEDARTEHADVSRALADARRRQENRLARLDVHGHRIHPVGQLAAVEGDVTAGEHELAAARRRIAELAADPARLAQPPDRLAQERMAWRARLDAEWTARRAAASPSSAPRPAGSVRPPQPVSYRTPPPGLGPGVWR